LKEFIYKLSLKPHYRVASHWSDEQNDILSRHFQYLSKLTADGVALLVGKTDLSIENEENYGIVIFQAVDEVEAKKIMENDPAVRDGIMTARLLPFNIVLQSLNAQQQA
jgi:uncharacterized protein